MDTVKACTVALYVAVDTHLYENERMRCSFKDSFRCGRSFRNKNARGAAGKIKIQQADTETSCLPGTSLGTLYLKVGNRLRPMFCSSSRLYADVTEVAAVALALNAHIYSIN